MRPINLQAALSGLALVLVGLTGCAARPTSNVGHPQPAAAEPALGPVVHVTDWRQIILPLDAYQPTLRATVLIERAVAKRTNVCARQFGMSFTPPVNKRDPAALSAARPSHYRLYGLLDAAHAASQGYRETGTNPPRELAYSKQTHTAAYYNVIAAKMGGGVVNGLQIPAGGCYGQAQRDVASAVVAPDASLPERLSGDAWQLSNLDSRVKAAFHNWSTCMADSGFNYQTPMQANDDPHWTGASASTAEIAVAVADVGCKKQTNLTGIRMAVDSAYQLVAMQANAKALSALKAGQLLEVRSAARILAAK